MHVEIHTHLDNRLVALANAKIQSAHLPKLRAQVETADLISLLRTHAADAIAGEQSDDEIMDGAGMWCAVFLMGRS